MMSNKIQSAFKDVQQEVLCQGLTPDEVKEKKGVLEPELFISFLTQTGASIYQPIPSMDKLKILLDGALTSYNESGNMVMDLELFGNAMEHVCRIVRIIEQPNGNALLVGVGGSGKQSLARLASSIAYVKSIKSQCLQTTRLKTSRKTCSICTPKPDRKEFPLCFY